MNRGEHADRGGTVDTGGSVGGAVSGGAGASRRRVGRVTTSVRPVEELVSGLEGGGWRVGVVSGGTSKREALDAVAAALAFPGYFGRNLDALWDCLTDLEQPTALVWAGWEPLAVFAPRDWAGIVSVLRARAGAGEEEPPFAAVFCVASGLGAVSIDTEAEPPTPSGPAA